MPQLRAGSRQPLPWRPAPRLVCIFFQPTSGALEQPVVLSTSHTNCSTSPTPLRGVGFTHLDNLDASPVRLVFDVLSELPERPRVQLSVEPSPFVAPDAFLVPDCYDSIQLLCLIHNGFSNLVHLVVHRTALIAPRFALSLSTVSSHQVSVAGGRSAPSLASAPARGNGSGPTGCSQNTPRIGFPYLWRETRSRKFSTQLHASR